RADAAIFALPHAAYPDLYHDEVVRIGGRPIAVVDCFGILDDARIWTYFKLGCRSEGARAGAHREDQGGRAGQGGKGFGLTPAQESVTLRYLVVTIPVIGHTARTCPVQSGSRSRGRGGLESARGTGDEGQSRRGGEVRDRLRAQERSGEIERPYDRVDQR